MEVEIINVMVAALEFGWKGQRKRKKKKRKNNVRIQWHDCSVQFGMEVAPLFSECTFAGGSIVPPENGIKQKRKGLRREALSSQLPVPPSRFLFGSTGSTHWALIKSGSPPSVSLFELSQTPLQKVP